MGNAASRFKVYDYIVLGCGISALTAARHLAVEHSVLILDRYKQPGGNHLSHVIDGLEFDIGAICFNTSDEQFRHFPELLALCVPKHVEVKKICTNGSVGKYPFDWEMERSSLSAWAQLSCLLSLLSCRLRRGSRKDAARYAQSRIGNQLYLRAGLDLYIRRLFGVEASEIDYDFAMKRMQWLARETSLRLRLARLLNRLPMTPLRSQTVVRPPGGFGRYYETALVSLRTLGVDIVLGQAPSAIRTGTDVVAVSTSSRTYEARNIISTIPLDEASALCGLPHPDLPTVTLVSLFVALRGSWLPECSILYNFHSSGNWKRITVHSDFYPTSGVYDHHLTVEITVPPGGKIPAAGDAFAEVETHLRKLNIVRGELVLMGSSELANAYPIPERGFKQRRDAAIASLAARHVICLGRQGKFEYIPHSNIAAKEAIVTLDRVLAPRESASGTPGEGVA